MLFGFTYETRDDFPQNVSPDIMTFLRIAAGLLSISKNVTAGPVDEPSRLAPCNLCSDKLR